MPATTLTESTLDAITDMRTGGRFTLNGQSYIMDRSRCWSTYAPTSADGERVTFYAWSVARKGPSRLVTVRPTSRLVVG